MKETEEHIGKELLSAIALGSNLGDCLSTLESAIETLAETPGITIVSKSSWHRTKAIGPPQPDYWNGCVVVQVTLTPLSLLENLLKIETKFGRVRRERWGPRTLDLDLLLYDNLILETPILQIPHSRMRERAFVLLPLAEIAPDWIDPVSQCTIAQLVEKLEIVTDIETSS